MIGSDQLREVLSAVGQLLEAKGKTVRIVIVGGASLNLAGLVDRATDDVDVIARAKEDEGGPMLIPPDPMPDALMAAVQRVARDFGLPSGVEYGGRQPVGNEPSTLPQREPHVAPLRGASGRRCGALAPHCAEASRSC